MIQLNFFETQEQSEIAHLFKEVARIEESGHRVRRGTYKSINELSKKFIEQENRISQLEHKLIVMEKFIREHLKKEELC